MAYRRGYRRRSMRRYRRYRSKYVRYRKYKSKFNSRVLASARGNESLVRSKNELGFKKFSTPWYTSGCIPQLLRTKLAYRTTLSTQAVGATLAQDVIFRGNSIYDPYYGAGGVTAYGQPELALLYHQYRVIGSRISVLAYCSAGTPHVAIFPSEVTTACTTPASLFGEHNVADGICVPSGYSGKDGRNPIVVKHSAYTSVVLHSKGAIGDIGFSSVMAGNPAHEWYWHVVFWGAQSGDTVFYEVEIDYYVHIFDPVRMTAAVF